MLYEFILKIKEHPTDTWEKKYRTVVKESRYELVKRDYEQVSKNFYDSIILINKLDNEGHFIEIIQ